MPLSIAATARLVEAGVLEKQGGTLESIQLAYAMALIRFVNMMTDRCQNKFFAQPIHKIAQEIGIPVWIVNIRHDATHGELPSLGMLKAGVEFALSWLQTDYWERNEDTDSSESEMNIKEQLRQLLIRYQQEQYMIIQMGWSQTNKAIVDVLADITEVLENSIAIQQIFEILLQDGFLVPTEQQEQSLAMNTSDNTNTAELQQIPEIFLNLWQPLLQKLSRMNILHSILEPLSKELCKCDNTNSAELQQIPEIFLNLWQPLLQKLSRMNILHSILEPLSKELCKCKRPMVRSAQYLVCWMRLFLETSGNNVCTSGVGSRHGLTISSSKVDWHHLVKLCVESPNPYTCHIVQRLIDYLKPPLTPDVKANVIELTEIYLNQFKVRDEVNDTDDGEAKNGKQMDHATWQPFSIGKIPTQSLRPCTSVSNKVAMNDGQILRRADMYCEAWQKSRANISWKEYPLGWLPGQQFHPEYLILKSKSIKSNKEHEEENNNRVALDKLESSNDEYQPSYSRLSTLTESTQMLAMLSPPKMMIF